MRIVIDLQGAQTKSRFRGIGRYTLELVKEIILNRAEHEVFIVLNGALSESIIDIRTQFAESLPQSNIVVWQSPGPLAFFDTENHHRRKVADKIRSACIVSLQPDVIFIPSLFEGFADDAVVSVDSFSALGIPVVVTCYDLIPLLYPQDYIENIPGYKPFYTHQLNELKKAQSWVTISESSKQEIIENLSVAPEWVTNASVGIGDQFSPQKQESFNSSDFLAQWGIHKPYFIYSGGADPRKNLENLIKAFAALPSNKEGCCQLVLAGNISDNQQNTLSRLAESFEIPLERIIFTGYVSDDDLIKLYQNTLAFVFPSWHEGFGLPVAEAMACGAAAIAGNASSLPEVVDNPEALFDPYSVDSMTQKMLRVLEDDEFRQNLIEHGLTQVKRFSWRQSALTTLKVFEQTVSRYEISSTVTVPNRVSKQKPKLAFFSPMPPDQSGIADYSAELLPALQDYYDIYLILSDRATSNQINLPTYDVEWFKSNADRMDVILYQFGNSGFHAHMLELIKLYPGILVLHDFFISGLLAYLDSNNVIPGIWDKSLLYSHGYKALLDKCKTGELEYIKLHYPVNLELIQYADGVIVHSEFSKNMAKKWYGEGVAKSWQVVPLVRKPVAQFDKLGARKQLGIPDDAFLVCSFGILAYSKLNHRLLKAWLDSELAKNPKTKLIFVGKHIDVQYQERLNSMLKAAGSSTQVEVTGWVNSEDFHLYLAASDMAVQLRTDSRGETSAAVLDCLNYGLPTIINANGSMAEIESDAVCKLSDDFDDEELIEALNTLGRDVSKRQNLAQAAAQKIRQRHTPAICAKAYKEAIGKILGGSKYNQNQLLQNIASINNYSPDSDELKRLSIAISQTFPLQGRPKKLLLDATATINNDHKTGIERFAKVLIQELIEQAPSGYQVEPVYLSQKNNQWHYCYARQYTAELIGCQPCGLVDSVVEAHNGDILLTLDLSGSKFVQASESGLHAYYRALGVKCYASIFDLLPLKMPNYFPPGAEVSFQHWLEAALQMDGVICISKAVVDDLNEWVSQNTPNLPEAFEMRYFHLGADFQTTFTNKMLSPQERAFLTGCKPCTTILMVGTIEPRKGHIQVVEAFNQLWDRGLDAQLVIIGKEGWQSLQDSDRRTIPNIVTLLEQHPYKGKKLHWLKDVSDQYLDELYKVADGLIVASEGEGFGLPLIEAAQHKLPVLARDIPVFREIGGTGVTYFEDSKKPEVIVKSVYDWLDLLESGLQSNADEMVWQTWNESAKELLSTLNIR